MRSRNVALLLLGFCSGVQAELSVKAIAAGGQNSLALASDGTVWEWGNNLNEPDGNTVPHPAPVQVSGLDKIAAVAAGQWYSLAVKEDGTVWAWGAGAISFLLPPPETPVGEGPVQYPAPVRLIGLEGVQTVAAGGMHILALKRDGTVWAVGSNPVSLGDGTTTTSFSPVQVSGLTGVMAIVAGGSHNLALKKDGTVWAWGANYNGQLGDGTTDNRSTPVQVGGLGDVTAVAAGNSHNLALRRDGTVWQWGFMPGRRPGPRQLTAVPVPSLTGVTAISAGYSQSLAVSSDGAVWQWGTTGDNLFYTSTDVPVPTPVTRLAGAVRVAAGMNHSLVLKSDGTIWAWGNNYAGQLGNGMSRYQFTRIQVNGIAGVTAVAGGQRHSLALKGDGTVWAWGGNNLSQLGDGTTTDRSTPAQVSELSQVAAISAGTFHNLALKEDGTVWAWGANSSGQLGDGTTDNHSTPVQVSGLSGVVAIAAGGFHNLALKKDGTVWTWGTDVGDATGRTRMPTPSQVSGLSEVVGIAADADHSLAWTSDGLVSTWGWIGWVDGSSKSQATPAQVSGVSDVVKAGLGSGNYLALKSDGCVWEWGIPERGVQSTPAQVSELSGVVALAGGNAIEYFCGNCGQRLALKSDGTVWAWGDDADGQLGDGTTTAWPGRLTPVQAAGLAGVVAIGAGDLHSLAVKDDRTVWAWGNNQFGQLGTEPTGNRMIPVQLIPLGLPDLAIAMSHDGEFTVGARAAYTLTITNNGVTKTTGTITVTDVLPLGLTYSSSFGDGWTCAAADKIVTCTNIGPVGPGMSMPITLTVDVDATAWPGVTNFATVDNTSDRNISNNAIGDPTVVLAGR